MGRRSQKDEKTVDGTSSSTKGGSRVAPERFYISPLGEPYYDILKVEAWLKNRTMAAEANSILCARLMQREDYRNRLIEECARKRGITFTEMWDLILCEQAPPLTPAEYAKLREADEGLEVKDLEP